MEIEKTEFYREYDLIKARKNKSNVNLAAHQLKALKNLNNWFETNNDSNKGGILVLPTGGGKTFTAIRFLCEKPLSEGYKVLWLAHTHHLLEQAYFSFGPKVHDQKRGFEVGNIKEPKNELNVRVVSGSKNYFKINEVEPTDDVLICTLQTITQGYKKEQPNLMKFLDSASGKLFVVFDEAHHSPAPSYRKLIVDLRKEFSDMYLLGLTATPTYESERRKGWLKDLFPQDILYQVSLNELMSQRILAKPEFEEPKTHFEPDFDEREYEKWSSTFRDLPDQVINQLANNRSRNQYIARVYAQNKDRFGKTLIFADRVEQCVQLCEFLRKEGVKAGAIFSRFYKAPNGRLLGSNEENSRMLEKFKNDELEALVNIRMLTEGTDVPSINSVFLTRQTTSKILLTQMVGRALRGPEFGGSEKAYIVSFIDDWKQKINWAEWDPLDESLPPEDEDFTPLKRPPWQLISIDLIRHVSRLMYKNNNMEIEPFLKSVPIGWYQTDFFALTNLNENSYNGNSEEKDDYASVSRLLMVFEDEKDSYEKLMDELGKTEINEFAEEEVKIDDHLEIIERWKNKFFAEKEAIGVDFNENIFYIACHMAQNYKERPKFFLFKEREFHDMDLIARKYMELNYYDADDRLHYEFDRNDRYWKTIYPNYELFKQQYDACVNRILNIKREQERIDDVFKTLPGQKNHKKIQKEKVKSRDSGICLCCGEDRNYLLEVDHINPKYFGGEDSLDNLQTLCRYCNTAKGTHEIDFRLKNSLLPSPMVELPPLKMPFVENAGDINHWIRFLSRIVNFFYKCNAVQSLNLENDNEWKIILNPKNDSSWIKPHLPELRDEIASLRKNAGLNGPDKITVM